MPAQSIARIRGNTSRKERFEIEDQFENQESALRILIATDTISEGKDLQHACQHLIHFELPWSLVRIEQRNGRIDRLGQKATPHIYNLILDITATPDQKILNRLTEKLEKAKEALGSVSPIITMFETIDREHLLDENGEKVLEEKIEDARRESLEFNPKQEEYSAAKKQDWLEDHSFDSQHLHFKVMLDSIGGSLLPYGQRKHNFFLSIPEGWEIPGMAELQEPYPSAEQPWLVTFDPSTFLNYEEQRRKNGESSTPLRFISPVHPLRLQIESRFRSKLTDKGYPVFKMSGSPCEQILVVELSARSDDLRLIAQQLVAIDLKSFQEINLNVIYESCLGIDQPLKMPQFPGWSKIKDHLSKKTTDFSIVLKKDYQKK